jgi:hypothetical protein
MPVAIAPRTPEGARRRAASASGTSAGAAGQGPPQQRCACYCNPTPLVLGNSRRVSIATITPYRRQRACSSGDSRLATIKKLDSAVPPLRRRTTAEARELYIDTPDAVDVLTYGDRKATNYVTGHDHGRSGGAYLARRLLSTSWGPTTARATTAARRSEARSSRRGRGSASRRRRSGSSSGTSS